MAGNYSILDCSFLWNGIAINEVKEVAISKPNEKWTMSSDNSSGKPTFVKNAAHKDIEVTIATAQMSSSNIILSASVEEGSTGVFAYYDNNGTSICLVKGKIMFTDETISNDPNDKNWKIIGQPIAHIVGGGLD